jgi:hypothetical protein
MAVTVLVEQDVLERFHGVSLDDCLSEDGCDHDDVFIPWLGKGGRRGCPGALIVDPAFQLALRTYNLRQVAPLDGWPHRYAAWVQDAMMAIEDGIAKKRRKAMERK